MNKSSFIYALGLLTLVAALSCSDGKKKTYNNYNYNLEKTEQPASETYDPLMINMSITDYRLEKTDKVVTFPIDPETRNNPYVYAFYRDKNGSEYFTMQNAEKRSNDILFYDWNTQQLAFKVKPTKEGLNGVG